MINKVIKNCFYAYVCFGALTGYFSCWKYSFQEKALPGIETIAIPLFIDRTDEIQVRDRLQNALINMFLDENIFKVVGVNQADAILSGVIESIDDVATQVTREEEAKRFELRITVMVKLEERNTGKTIMTQRLTGLGDYENPLDKEREDAISEALDQITRDIANTIVSGW